MRLPNMLPALICSGQYFATNLGNGSHTVAITNNVVGNATFLDVDQIGVYRSPSYSDVTTTASSGATSLANMQVNQADAANDR